MGEESGVPYDKGDDMMGLGQGEAAGPGTDTECPSCWNIWAADLRGVSRPRP